MKMVRIGVIGAGRIGTIHAQILSETAGAELAWICDPRAAAAEAVVEQYGGRAVQDIAGGLSDPGTDAIVIASSTATHAAFLEACTHANKPVLCEKPVDLDLQRIHACRDAIGDAAKLIQMGFNRRFNAEIQAMRQSVTQGHLGKIENLHIITRVPSPPNYDYVHASGGLFKDMMIHDFDFARFLLGDDVDSIFATGSALIDPALSREGDIDTAMVTLRMRSGALVHIANSRRCAYGFDQRIEVFGADGSMSARIAAPLSIAASNASGTGMQSVLAQSPIAAYHQSYVAQMKSFVKFTRDGGHVEASFMDGLRAIEIAEAANLSLASGKACDVVISA